MGTIVVETAAAVARGELVPGELAATAAKFGLTVFPLHAGIADPAMASWYAVDLDEDRRASDVLDALRSLPSVTAAYEKPRDALP